MKDQTKNNTKLPSLALSLIPVGTLLTAIVSVIITQGSEAALSVSHYILFGAAVLAAILALVFTGRTCKQLLQGLIKSAKQTMPAIPVLLSIATVSASWMMSGVVPTLIVYGLEILNPMLFLFLTCSICAIVSVLSGTSWTTIATIGVAFIGIGSVMGYEPGWIAGAIISGAYFGDKVSPLSDSTVLASTSCGVEMFTHIKYMMITTVPSMTISLLVFLAYGLFSSPQPMIEQHDIIVHLQSTFNISPWPLLIPLITCTLIIFRVKPLMTLIISTSLGIIGMFIFQPQIVASIDNNGFLAVIKVLFTSTSIDTGDEMLNSLVATGGMEGMMPTIYLVLCAMTFGGMLLGSGMIAAITKAFTRRLHSIRSIVTTTVGSGLFFNACTGDQYLSIILGGNVYKKLYRDNGLETRLLSRTLEDSVSVTSVLIPWNSCGVTQATVLGVATLTYLPYCIFNYLSPIMSIIVAYIGYKIVRQPQEDSTAN
ncbi:MAG: sodium:proton antiporter [Muribaculaceae bacterium]|nr:sodium:proton antiporter [Muribaculaceae bacterium]